MNPMSDRVMNSPMKLPEKARRMVKSIKKAALSELNLMVTVRMKNSMKIIVTSIFVQDQDKALEFYSEKLGFVKKEDVPVGEFRWITLVSPDDQDGTELLLEPNDHPAAKDYQKKIFADGIPATMFGVCCQSTMEM